jgi:hypothetical protein
MPVPNSMKGENRAVLEERAPQQRVAAEIPQRRRMLVMALPVWRR